MGWYHSHPGYGCWLSGIDVGTQMAQQQYQDPFLAIVVDPHRTLAAGKVEIGAFRTYPEVANASTNATVLYNSSNICVSMQSALSIQRGRTRVAKRSVCVCHVACGVDVAPAADCSVLRRELQSCIWWLLRRSSIQMCLTWCTCKGQHVKSINHALIKPHGRCSNLP